jgi:hypothetical protein
MQTWTLVLPLAVALAPVNNTCMDAVSKPPSGPKTFDCPGFVIKSTDDTWHMRDWAMTNASIDKYFAPHWQSVRAFGTIIDGKTGLREFMQEWLAAFPDVFIQMSDLFCEGNDEIGYKTTMPYVLTATNTGPSIYGPATGKKVKYHGIANCYIAQIDGQWQYTTEWDVPDMWSFLTAMDLKIDDLPHPAYDMMTLDDCKPLFEWKTGYMHWFPTAEAITEQNLLAYPRAKYPRPVKLPATSDASETTSFGAMALLGGAVLSSMAGVLMWRSTPRQPPLLG